MKKKYVKPISMVVVIADALCEGDLKIASVVNSDTGKSVDLIKIENENESSKNYDWDNPNSWGGD
ncbi:MAG: hypothetical protein SPF96_04870 [Prevotella sp.]|nr:hypothetical protein [Prevotella sp.]